MLSLMRPETYALTAVAHQRRRLFQVTANADLLIATLVRYSDQGRFLVHGFAIMPEHIHVLLTPSETIERAAQMIKGGYSFAMRRNGPGEIWQPGYHAHRITSAEDYRNQFGYIADNPRQRGLVDHPHVEPGTPIASIGHRSIAERKACRRG